MSDIKNDAAKEGDIEKEEEVDKMKETFLSWLDKDFYRNQYQDLKDVTDDFLIHHYKYHGYQEGRINSKRHKEFMLQNVDLPFYREFYDDNEALNEAEVIMPFPYEIKDQKEDVKQIEKTLVIYVFHKVNTYVRLFIDKCFFKDEYTDFIMVANIPGFDFKTLSLPSYVTQLSRNNVGWDNGGYSAALLANDNYKKYKNFVFVNSTVIGPFMPDYCKEKWTTVLTNGLINDIHCFGTMINTEKDPLNKSHVQSCCFALTKEGANELIEAGVFSNDPKKQYSTHKETILNKEINMSRVILNKGWNIGCLFPGFKGIDFKFINKKPTDYGKQSKFLYAGDMMYPKFRYTVWDPYQIVFYKGNRFY